MAGFVEGRVGCCSIAIDAGRTDENEPRNAHLCRSSCECFRTPHVDIVKGLVGVDRGLSDYMSASGQMDDYVNIEIRLGPSSRTAKFSHYGILNAWKWRCRFSKAARYRVAAIDEQFHNSPTDESGRTGDQDLHV